MSGDPPEPEPEPEPEWQRRRRLAEVFGAVLPETTADERPQPTGEPDDSDGSDARLRAEVPPHHG